MIIPNHIDPPAKRKPEQRRILLSHIFSNLVLSDETVLYTLKAPVQKLAERVQQRIDLEKTFELKKRVVTRRQKGTFVPSRPSLLRR